MRKTNAFIDSLSGIALILGWPLWRILIARSERRYHWDVANGYAYPRKGP